MACLAPKAGSGFTQQDHCFTTVTDAAELAQIADPLSHDEIAGRLRQLCERWIYAACLCFALDLEEQKRSAFHYHYSVFQMEYSRNRLFSSGRQREQVFQARIDRTRAPLDLDRVKTIFGDKKRPHQDKRKKNPTRWGVVVERPTYDVTIFQVHYGKMTLKIYSKGEHVLRMEVIVHNTKQYRWRRSLPYFPEIVTRLKAILERFLNVVGCINACFISDATLEKLPLAGTDRSDQGRRYRSQPAQNAPGGRSGSGALRCASGLPGFGPSPAGPLDERPAGNRIRGASHSL